MQSSIRSYFVYKQTVALNTVKYLATNSADLYVTWLPLMWFIPCYLYSIPFYSQVHTLELFMQDHKKRKHSISTTHTYYSPTFILQDYIRNKIFTGISSIPISMLQNAAR